MIHLIIAVDPVKDGEEATGMCGVKITSAKAVPLTELGENLPRSTVTFCKKCFGRRYFYAICEEQEAHDIENKFPD